MNEIQKNSRKWYMCVAVCSVACIADTMLPIGDTIGAAAGAYQYS